MNEIIVYTSFFCLKFYFIAVAVTLFVLLLLALLHFYFIVCLSSSERSPASYFTLPYPTCSIEESSTDSRNKFW